jgi:hypothetical protein
VALDVPAPDTVYNVVTVDLGVGRAAPGTEITLIGGDPIRCRNLLVMKLTGSCYVRINNSANDGIPLEALIWGTGFGWNDTEIRHLFVENLAQPGKTLVLHSWRVG